MNSDFKVGEIVKWIDSHYKIVEIKKDKVHLKQLFSIGITLKDIKIDELKKVNNLDDYYGKRYKENVNG